MKVHHGKNSNLVPLRDLNGGDVFLYQEAVWIVTSSGDSDNRISVLDVADGFIEHLEDDILVTKVEAVLLLDPSEDQIPDEDEVFVGTHVIDPQPGMSDLSHYDIDEVDDVATDSLAKNQISVVMDSSKKKKKKKNKAA